MRDRRRVGVVTAVIAGVCVNAAVAVAAPMPVVRRASAHAGRQPTLAGRPCAIKRGWHVLARSGSEFVATAGQEYGNLRLLACVRATGRPRTLAREDNSYGSLTVPVRAAVNGGYALVAFTYGDKYSGCDSSLVGYNLADGKTDWSFDAGCTRITSPIPANVDSLALNQDGFAAWTVTEPIPSSNPEAGISCPTVSLCVTVDRLGNAFASTDPTGGRATWAITPQAAPEYGFDGISCADATLCVGIDDGGDVITSTDPTGGAPQWSTVNIESGMMPDGFSTALSAIDCPTSALCIGVDDNGNVVTSTDPTGGAGAWSATQVGPAAGQLEPARLPTGVSCPTVSECFAVDPAGKLLSSTDPGISSSWTASSISSSPLTGIACPSTALCVAVDAAGDAFTSTDPTGGPSAWQRAHIYTVPQFTVDRLDGVACASSNLCVAFDDLGNILTSTDPTGGPSAWQEGNLEGGATGYQPITALTCPSIELCSAADDGGRVLTSTAPNDGPASWTTTLVDAPPCAPATPCLSEQLYTHDDQGTHTIDTAPPGFGHSIAHIRITGSTVTWTHDGTPKTAPVR